MIYIYNITKNYYFVTWAKQKAQGSTLTELREQKEKDKKKDKKGKGKGKATPFINPNQKILLNTKEDIKNNMRESNRTKILMDLEYAP